MSSLNENHIEVYILELISFAITDNNQYSVRQSLHVFNVFTQTKVKQIFKTISLYKSLIQSNYYTFNIQIYLESTIDSNRIS